MSSHSVEHEPVARRIPTQVTSLRSLVGAHPAALRRMFGTGRPTDPAELGDAPRGLLLAFSPGADLFLLTRPLVRVLASAIPWRGKTFDHGGNSGQNVVLGQKLGRFQAEVGPSEIDGRPALALTYDAPAHDNRWPLRRVRDELRTVGTGIAIGPAIVPVMGSPFPLFWFGLEARGGA